MSEHVDWLSGTEVIARQRAKDAARFSAEHDDHHHQRGQLVEAAMTYLQPESERACSDGLRSAGVPYMWPWSSLSWNPSPEDRIKELGKVGALVAAEIDRLQRDSRRNG